MQGGDDDAELTPSACVAPVFPTVNWWHKRDCTRSCLAAVGLNR
jgi:hypothetical protein